MKQELTKKIAQELMLIKGKARGVHFENDFSFVLKEKGELGLKKVEEELIKIGCPIEYKKINSFDFYPIGLRAISLLAIQKTFNWPNEKIEEIGVYAMKVSWIIRLFAKYFFSIEKVLEKSQQIWFKHFTVGRLKVEAFDPEKKYVILKIEDFKLHPIYCHCLNGVFSELARMTVNPKKISCQEIKCPFKNEKEKNHYFLVKWEK